MLLLVAAAASLPFVLLLWRRPVLRRLAVRNAARRPREAALVVLGSLFGTAIITGSLVVGDTIDSSVRGLAHTRLGPIDEVVVTQDPGTYADVLGAVQATESALIDGVLGIGHLDVTTAVGQEGDRRAAPRSVLLELDFEAAASFGDDPEITGVAGPTPEPGHAAITDDLADVLEAGPGATVTVFAYGGRHQFVVDRVVPTRGVAGFRTGFFNQPSRNILVPPGTLATLTRGVEAELGTRFAPPNLVVAVSNRGGVEDGAVHTGEVTRRLRRSLEGVGVDIVPVKQDILDEAEEDAAEFQELFTAMGAFGVLAGVLLLVNIFVMLGEERKPELGMLRAVGLRRASLVGAFSLEGWFYSLAAAAIGTVVGLGLGRVIILAVARIFENDLEGFGVPLRFSADGASLQLGFTAGFLIALVTVVLTSVRIGRFNVIRAIRDLPEPPAQRLRARWLVAGALAFVVGALLSLAGLSPGAHEARLLGPVLALLGGAVLLSRWVPRRLLTTGMSAVALLWAALGFPITSNLGEAGVFAFVLQGIVLTAAAVVLVSQEHDAFERVARRLGVGRWAMAMRLGLAYPVARRFRTGLTLAMYSLVIFTLTFITVLSATFSNQIDETTRRVSGGYSIFARSNPSNPVPVEDLQTMEGVGHVAPISTVPADFVVCRPDDGPAECTGRRDDWSASGFDESLLAVQPPILEDRGPYASDRAAYEAVLADPSLVLADVFFLSEGGGPQEYRVAVGDRLEMVNDVTGERRTVTVAAISADDFLFNGALYGAEGFRDLFGERAVPNRYYVQVAGGVDPGDLAATMAGRFVEHGMQADPIREHLAEFIAVQNQFFQLFRGYLGFGLLVGIAGLGVVMVRAVRERRREIGVLRALGFQSQTVRRSFVLEAGFVALEGTLIGIGLALVTAYNLMANTDAFGESARFTLPFGALALVAVGTLAASLLATAAPTRSAARIRPAVALRIAD